MSDNSEKSVGDGHLTMKVCRYCFESIRLEAIKCRFCGSSFSGPGRIDSNDDKHVTYIVDRDLVRFAKFSVSVLALVTVIGALFYGIDVKKLRSEIENEHKTITSLSSENKKLSQKLKASLNLASDLQSKIKNQAETARANARRAELALASIQETQNLAVTKYKEIVALQDGTLTILQQTETTSRTSAARSRHGKLWPNGATLHIRFLDGKKDDHAKVEKWAKTWSEFANIHFTFDNDPNAEIRISFKKGDGSWSYVGRDNVEVVSQKDRPTMNLGWLDEANVLHQFGHVLGLMHEHQNPYEPVSWNEVAVYKLFSGVPNHWTKEQIERNILQPFDKSTYPIPKPFDVTGAKGRAWGRGDLAWV